MNKIVKRMGIGTAAVAVLVGTSYGSAEAARQITSAQIKDETIRVVDLSDGVVKKLNKTGEQGEPGPAGPAGADGKDGKDGINGINGKDGKDGINGKDGAPGATGPAGPAGAAGPAGPAGRDGVDGLAGAVYRVTEYANGGGGDATVACADTEAESVKYTAIAGGVQADVPSTTTGMSGEFDMAASFPGRMDWATGQPKADRLDGWIVLGAGGHSDTLRVWALCVPNDSIPTEVVTIQN